MMMGTTTTTGGGEEHDYPSYVATQNDAVATPLELAAAHYSNNSTGGVSSGEQQQPSPLNSSRDHDHYHPEEDHQHNNSHRHRHLFPSKIKPKRLWKQFTSDTLTVARMHTVGSASERNLQVTNSHDTFDDELGQQQQSSSSPIACMSVDSPKVAATLKRIDTWASYGSEYLQVPEGGSLGAAIFGIIKGTVGPAILYLPRGFQISGYGVAIPSMIFATIMYIYNAHRLLACWRVEHQKDLINYGEHSRTLLTYPELARRAFGPFSVLVDIGIASMQFGVCLTYLIFVPHNLYECTQALLGLDVDKAYFLLAMLMVEIPLGWIRDITKLTPTNVVATGLIAYGLLFVLVLAIIQGMNMTGEGGTRVFVDNLENLPAFTDTWFLFVGTSFFMMEGSITLLVPLQESLQRSEDRAVFPRTNQAVTANIVIFYVFFSIVCCGAFGDDIHTALTASLNGTIAITIQLAYSVAVILTFPLQAFPAMEVVKNNLLGADNNHHTNGIDDDHVTPRVISTLVICLLGIVAICAIDYLGNVVSILGSLFGIPLALVIPPLMHNTLVEDSTNLSRFMNKCVVVIGFMAMGAASFATIVSWDKGAEGEP